MTRLALSAGETSGDLLAADLARALRARLGDTELMGVTGRAMRGAGVASLATTDELDVMGLFEVLRHVPRLVRLRRRLAREIAAQECTAFIGVDAPDFNIGLARRLKRGGTLAVQLVAPSVWAWRRYRIPKIARSLDLLLTLFPFEPGLFDGTGLDVRFVGHPLADALPLEPDRAAARERLDLPASAPVVALLPGSRPGELARHAGLVAETARRLRDRRPDAQPVVLLADPAHESLLASAVPAYEPLRVVCGRTREGLAAADVALAASGTVTLEALLSKTPMVVFYRLDAATYGLARALRLVRSRWVSLPNVLAGEELVPERLQAEAEPGRLVDDLCAWLDDDARRERFERRARSLHDGLANGAAETAASVVAERLDARV